MSPFESSLERDLTSRLEFDRAVESYLPQPVRIQYRLSDGRRQTGVPDFLVRFSSAAGRPPELIDVKYRAELREKWATLKPRLKAALRYALDQGWTYRLKTEVEIRTPYLVNARFLLPFRRLAPTPKDRGDILELIGAEGVTTPRRLLECVAQDQTRRAEILPVVWYLVAQFIVCVDLQLPLTMDSRIFLDASACDVT